MRRRDVLPTVAALLAGRTRAGFPDALTPVPQESRGIWVAAIAKSGAGRHAVRTQRLSSQQRRQLFQLADDGVAVSTPCRVYGASGTSYYRWHVRLAHAVGVPSPRFTGRPSALASFHAAGC